MINAGKIIARLLLVFVLVACWNECGAEGKRFKQINPDKCTTLNRDFLPKFPKEWQKYGEFIKCCSLDGADSRKHIFIASVWILDYYDSKFPTTASRPWEKFPLPVIIDRDFQILGQLPEHFPDDPPRAMTIYYRESSNIPPDIRLEVQNPAVDGDYSYSLMVWNKAKNKYTNKVK